MPAKNHVKRRTKIVCTIGPATGSSHVIQQIIKRGMNIARLNLSHGTREEHARYIKTIRKMEGKFNGGVAILMDLPGPKYRTGRLKQSPVYLEKGKKIVLTTRQIEGDGDIVPVNLSTLPLDVKVGNRILLDDGAMQLRVTGIENTEVICKVVVGGKLTPGRGVVVPGMHISSPFINDILIENLDFAIQQKPDHIALSFVSRPEDVEQVRNILKEKNSDIPLISKIERAEGVANFDKILAVSDGIMVARGDLGVEMPLKRIPSIQKEIIKKCNRAGKAVITATQMLESMINSARPTRAEVTDVANAIMDGTDAIMLSAETSIGKYPVQSVQMMAEITEETEKHLPYELILNERGKWLGDETDELISYNACHIAHWLKAAAIFAFTQSGSTARRVSKYRPSMPIIALTPSRLVSGRLLLYWGVQAYYIKNPLSVDQLFAEGARVARELGLARTGDLIIITGGIPVAKAGTTNLLKVEKIS